MRIFVALDIDDAIRQRIARFMEGVQGFAPAARWVRPESMHVTLKFIGEKSEQAVGKIRQALEGIEASAMEIRCFIILETSDARKASNATWKFSIRTRGFCSCDDFFI